LTLVEVAAHGAPFINREMLKGEISFEEFAKRINPVLKS
jgi:hypothetical protein